MVIKAIPSLAAGQGHHLEGRLRLPGSPMIHRPGKCVGVAARQALACGSVTKERRRGVYVDGAGLEGAPSCSSFLWPSFPHELLYCFSQAVRSVNLLLLSRPIAIIAQFPLPSNPRKGRGHILGEAYNRNLSRMWPSHLTDFVPETYFTQSKQLVVSAFMKFAALPVSVFSH